MQSINVQSVSPAVKPRIFYIDNIRWTVIAMVVLMHACVTYSGMGSWFHIEPGHMGIGATLVFSMYQIFAQAFFMGLLFFVAAVFVPFSRDRKGFLGFMRDRAFRLGIPSLVFMLILDPLTNPIRDLGTGNSAGEAFGVKKAAQAADTVPTPRSVHVAAAVIMAVIAAGSFFIRLVMPIDTSWLNMQLCFFPQYVVMFAVGLWAGRRGILRTLPGKTGMLWLKLAFIIGVPSWFLLLGLGGALTGSEQAFKGGMHWQAAGYAAWEAFFAVSVSIGLLTLYREKANARSKATGVLADTSFGVYVFHTPILVAVSIAMKSFATYPLAKAAIVSMAAFALSLGFAWLVRKTPGLGKVFA